MRAGGHRELGSAALVDNAASIAAQKAFGFAEKERIVCFVKKL